MLASFYVVRQNQKRFYYRTARHTYNKLAVRHQLSVQQQIRVNGPFYVPNFVELAPCPC
jgi:hypothetical protein